MKKLLTKRLPSTLLALVMVVSLLPVAVAAASADLSYEVAPGEEIKFSRTDFKNLFEEEYTDFSYLVFTEYDDLDTYGHLYAEDEDGDWGNLDEDDLDDNIWFYYTSSDVDNSIDRCLKDLTFVADDDADDGTLILEFTLVGDDDDDTVDGILEIEIDNTGSSDADLSYELDPGEEIEFSRTDFKNLFEEEYENFSYLVFTEYDDLDTYGYLYAEDEDGTWGSLGEDDLDENIWFYYSSNDVDNSVDRCLKDLTFVADDDADDGTLILEFTLVGDDDDDTVDSVLEITIGEGSDEEEVKADITVTVEEDEEISIPRSELKNLFEKKYEDFCYLRFTDSSNLDSNGYIYSKAYDDNDEEFYEVEFDEDDITDGYFYYSKNDVEDDGSSYTLSDLTFVADDDADGKVVTLNFTLYGDNTSHRVTGILRIEIGDVTEVSSKTGDAAGDILYMTTYNTNVQLKASDFDRFLKKSFPSSSLQYVKLAGVPSVGGLYYNYYGTSSYGTAARTKLTASNCDDQSFYLSPADIASYALSELTYIPSGTNYCAEIPFTAYGSGSKSVIGSVLISVSMKAVSEVYGVVPKNTAVTFPAPSLLSAVVAGTSSSFSSIQLLSLPSSKQGTVYVGTGTTRKADTSTLYSYADKNTWQISQLRFVPATGYTGSVEIPYAACNSSGTPIAVGKFCLGFVTSVKKFSDVTSSAWCYKYITELASAGVIDGYADGTYKFNNTVTYGAALKLVMLAAGYPEQKDFNAYLALARSEGIVTRNNVDLTKPITRLQVAQLASGALDLDVNNLSTIKPFTDTSDAHIQALNAAGIIEGYFANGTSTYKPGNTLTRGQLSAIVWRMQNYRK